MVYFFDTGEVCIADKEKTMKKLLIVAVVGAMVLALAGCNKATPKQITGKTMKIMLSEEPGSADALATAFSDWAAATGNKTDIMVIPYDDQLTKFPAMAKNKDLPDLISTTRLHQLYPEEFLDMRSVIDVSTFEETALKIVGKDYLSDKITGLTQQYTITNMYYNKDAFAKAGISAPTVDAPWTWDELYANAAKLQKSGGVKYGFAADVSRARYDILMYANGGSLVEKNGDKFVVTVNSPTNIATLDRFIKANNEVMPRALWSGGTTDNPANYFKNGDIGIYLSGSWNYNAFFTEITKFKFGVMPTPKGPAGSSAIIGGAALAIPSNAKNKDVAIAFIKWLYDPVNFQKYLNNDKGLSSLKGVIYQPPTPESAADYEVLQSEVKSITDTFMVDESSAWRTFLDNEYRTNLKRAVAGEMTAKTALDDFAKNLSEKSGWAKKY
jgi:ABC-type glycerol-3-phosphate transport system substrate-binding protein